MTITTRPHTPREGRAGAAPPLTKPPAAAYVWPTWRDLGTDGGLAVSVIVPAGEEDEDLDVRLPAVLQQTAAVHEVVVIDTSPDGRHLTTVGRIEQQQTGAVIRYLRSPATALAGVRRLAAALAAGNVRLFAFAGATPGGRWVESLTAPFRRRPEVALP